MGGKRIAEDEAARIVEEAKGKPGTITKLETKEETERPQLLYDLTSLQRHANTLHGFSARRTLSAAQKLYEEHKALTYPRTNSRFVTGDMVDEIKPIAELVGHNPSLCQGRRVRGGTRGAAVGTRGQRRQGPGPPRDHPHQVRARPQPHGRRRAQGLRPRGQALPGHLPSRRQVRAHARGDHRGRPRLPDQRPGTGRGRLARRLWGGGAHPGQARRRLGRRSASAEARTGRGHRDARDRVAAQGDPASPALHRGVDCSPRWRARARRWRTRSYGRR